MTLLATALLSATAAAEPAKLPTAEPLSPVTTVTVEELPVGSAAAAFAVADGTQPLLQTIEFPGDHKLFAKLRQGARLCPPVSFSHQRITLRCPTSRFVTRQEGAELMVVSLRGLPTRGLDAPPSLPHDPHSLGTAPRCPSQDPLTQAECAFEANDFATAFRSFSVLAVPGSTDGAFADLRLGDIATAVNAPEQALHFYDQLRERNDPLAELGRLRRCELLGDCSPTTLTADSYLSSLRDEVVLRVARWNAFHAQWSKVVATLKQEMPATNKTGACRRAETTCRRLVLGALVASLRASDESVEANALTTYLDSPSRLSGPMAEPLADAAAAVSEQLGVPRFGAHLLAAAYPLVPREHRSAHLLQTLELYQAADDVAHADAVAEFARAKLPAAELATADWRRALRATPGKQGTRQGRTPTTYAKVDSKSEVKKAESAQ